MRYVKVITITKAADDNLKQHLNKKLNMIIIHNGVDIEKLKNEALIKLTELEEITNGKKVLMQVASFREQKDQDTLIKALAHLGNDVIAVFIGEGKRMKKCFELSEKLGLSERVFFLGASDKIGAYLSYADVVVMSSHYEGFGRAAVEGMALGKPVIASDVAGLADVVKGAGILFEKCNEVNLAFKIEKLLNDLELYKLVSENCKTKAMDFGIEAMIDAYEKVYQEVLPGKINLP